MVRRAYTVVGAASAAVVATLVAASLSTGSLLGPQQVSRGAGVPPAEVPTPPHVQAGDDGAIPTWFTVTMTVLLALYALALIVLAAMHRRGREEHESLAESPEDEIGSSADWQVVLPVDLGDAARAQLAVLHLGTPRNAVVACWMSLRTATVRAGMPEVASETSEEFMVRAMESLWLDPPAITVLAALYREARFSEHPMTETHRDRAGSALRVLADQVERRRSEQAPDRVLEGLVR
jgi:hypothetical protein